MAHGPSLNDALKGPDAKLWRDAIEAEYNTLYNTKAWEIVPANSIPSGKTALTGTIVLKVRQNDPAGRKYNAQVVVEGSDQVPGVDFHETYSPVVNFHSIRALLTVGANLNYEIHQLAYDSAFLNASVKEEVYLKPIGSTDKRIKPGAIYKLRKTLYGLKQSPREWWLLLRDTLRKLLWKQTLTDQCIFFRDKPTGREYLAVSVDNLVVLTPSKPANTMEQTKRELMNCFKVKDHGELFNFLGIRFSRDRKAKTIIMDQESAINSYLKAFKVQGTADVPSYLNDIPQEDLMAAPKLSVKEFQERVGALQYICLHTRPDMNYAVSTIARSMQQPTTKEFAELNLILQYLKSSSNMAQSLVGSDISTINSYSNSDWAGDISVRKTVSGNVTFLGKSAICYTSKSQKCVTINKTESDLVSLTSSCQDALWLKNLMSELIRSPAPKIVLHPDHMPVGDLKGRYLSVRFHFIKNLLETGQISISPCKS